MLAEKSISAQWLATHFHESLVRASDTLRRHLSSTLKNLKKISGILTP